VKFKPAIFNSKQPLNFLKGRIDNTVQEYYKKNPSRIVQCRRVFPPAPMEEEPFPSIKQEVEATDFAILTKVEIVIRPQETTLQ
jgi:hypothetical protein